MKKARTATTVMEQTVSLRTMYSTEGLLNYIHAPIIILYYLGTHIFSLCISQKAELISRKRRRCILAFLFTILVAYIAEILYYLRRSIEGRDYEVPQFSAIRCLGSILVWILLAYLLWASRLLRWHTDFGTFVLQFVLETTTCLIPLFSITEQDRRTYLPFIISCIRAVTSLLLLLDTFFILFRKQVENSTDEERQSLMGKRADRTAGTSGTRSYGGIPQDALSGNEEAAPKDDDKDMKVQQAKRLEEEDGWLGYWKSFAIFLPYQFLSTCEEEI